MLSSELESSSDLSQRTAVMAVNHVIFSQSLLPLLPSPTSAD